MRHPGRAGSEIPARLSPRGMTMQEHETAMLAIPTMLSIHRAIDGISRIASIAVLMLFSARSASSA